MWSGEGIDRKYVGTVHKHIYSFEDYLQKKDAIVDKIARVANNANSTDDALDKLRRLKDTKVLIKKLDISHFAGKEVTPEEVEEIAETLAEEVKDDLTPKQEEAVQEAVEQLPQQVEEKVEQVQQGLGR